MRIETRQWLPMTHCVGYLLTHRFGSHTQLRFLRQYTDHYSTYTFSHVGTHTHTDRCGTVGERMPERGKIKRIKSVMPTLNVHWRLVSLEFHWSHFPQFTESWALVMNTQDVEVYWERWDRPKGILHLHSVTGFDFGSWKQILITVPNTNREEYKMKELFWKVREPHVAFLQWFFILKMLLIGGFCYLSNAEIRTKRFKLHSGWSNKTSEKENIFFSFRFRKPAMKIVMFLIYSQWVEKNIQNSSVLCTISRLKREHNKGL